VDLTTLHVIKPAPIDGIVERCEDLLDRAKSGDITSLAVVYYNRADEIVPMWYGPFVEVLGLVDRLKFRVNQSKDEE
jgi:hypothetical protein